MKRTCLLVFASLLLATAARSQTAPRFYVALKGGLSFPIVAFASAEDQQKAELANLGPNGTLAAGFRVAGNFSLGLTLGGWINPVSNTRALTKMRDVYPSFNFSQASAGSWRVGMALLTPSYLFALNPGLALDLRLHGGVLRADYPWLKATGSVGGFTFDADVQRVSATAAAFGAGADLRLHLTGPLHLLVGGDVIAAVPKFPEGSLKATVGPQAVDLPRPSYSQRVNSLNAHVGLAFYVR